jgi:transcriptional regulator with GAF, ATPase, and Fis domain
MVEVTQELAERISEVARLLESDDDSDAVLHRITSLCVELIPGATAAAVTIAAGDHTYTFAASDPRIDELHRIQFESGRGPAVETLSFNEPRHARDVTREQRWTAFCHAAADAGFGSCLALPLHSSRQPAGAVAIYAEHPGAFKEAAHDIALLFAAQGGTALHNAEVYGACRHMARNLQAALEGRAIIEQAKDIVSANLGIPAEQALQLIRQTSQDTNQKMRDIAAQLIAGSIDLRRPHRN